MELSSPLSVSTLGAGEEVNAMSFFDHRFESMTPMAGGSDRSLAMFGLVALLIFLLGIASVIDGASSPTPNARGALANPADALPDTTNAGKPAVAAR